MRGSASFWAGSTVLFLSGCGLILGAGDYEVGETTSTTGGEVTASSSGTGTTTSTSSGTGGSVAGLVVKPGTTTILGGGTMVFTAELDGVPTADVTWSVVEQNGGDIDMKGRYRAPLFDGTYHVSASLSSNDSAQAAVNVTTKANNVKLTTGDGLFAPSGFGMLSHLAYAEGLGEWWLFTNDATGGLSTVRSKNFQQWAPDKPLSLSEKNSSDGRDLAVASRRIGGTDVVHISEGTNAFSRFHIRATLADGGIEFGTPYIVNAGGDTSPDGGATAILGDGTILDVSGWQPTPQTPPLSPCGNGDVDIFKAEEKEDGLFFTGKTWSETVVWCVNNHVNAHQILELGDKTLFLYEDGANDTTPVNVLMTIRNADGSWTPFQGASAVTPPSVFGSDQDMGLNDWTATVAGGRAHAVRNVNGVFEYTSFSGTGKWLDGPDVPPPHPIQHNDGLFLAPYGEGLILVGISSQTGSSLVYTMFDGNTWTAWTPFVASPDQPSFVSGFAPAVPGVKPAVIWTEGGSVHGTQLP